MVADLTHLPVRVSDRWIDKTVTTDPPRYTPHTEWSLALKLAAATPLRVAVFLDRGRETAWGLWSGAASSEIELSAKFFPHDWARSDDVQINFEWQRHTVTDASLKSDPRESVIVTTPPSSETGEVFTVAELPAHEIVLKVLAIVEGDTEARRQDRWRIKPEFSASLPDELIPLTSGSQSGVTRT